MEANLYLEDRAWKNLGWQVQILVNQCVRESCPWRRDGSVICVNRLSGAVDGCARQFLDAAAEPPWEKVSVETLFEVQENLILHDPNGLWARLRENTAPARMPEWLWRKRVILEVKGLVWADLFELELAVRRRHWPEASVLLGAVTADLLRLPFYVNRRYYPWRTHLRSAFDRLPLLAPEIADDIDTAATTPDWADRLRAVKSATQTCLSYLAENDLVPGVDFAAPEMLEGLAWGLGEELVWAQRCEAWSNPDWRDWIVRCKSAARKAGEDVRDYWVFSLWGKL